MSTQCKAALSVVWVGDGDWSSNAGGDDISMGINDGSYKAENREMDWVDKMRIKQSPLFVGKEM